jgi:hypothetical protein
MKPKPYVQLQALGVLLVTIVCLVVLGSEAALALAVSLSVGGTIWGYFALFYTRRRRRSDFARSVDRASKDGAMRICFFVGLLLPGGLAWGIALAGTPDLIAPPLQGGQAALTSLGALLIPLSMLLSSSVDWYLIRSFREGVHDLPACQPEIQAGGRTMDYARYWVLHRMVAEFFVYAAIVGLIALTVTIAGENTDSKTGENVANLVGLVGIVSWSLSELGKLRAALEFVRYPTRCGLASWVTGRTKGGVDISGLVLDVSIKPGVQLIGEPRGHPAPDIAEEARSVPLYYRDTIEPVAPPVPVCPGRECEFWIPDCEIGLRRLEAQGDVASSRDTAPAPQ